MVASVHNHHAFATVRTASEAEAVSELAKLTKDLPKEEVVLIVRRRPQDKPAKGPTHALLRASLDAASPGRAVALRGVHLRNKVTDLLMSVSRKGRGEPLVQGTGHHGKLAVGAGAAERFTLVFRPDGFVLLVSESSKLAVGVAAGGQVVQGEADGDRDFSPVWTLVHKDGFVALRSATTGRYLEAPCTDPTVPLVQSCVRGVKSPPKDFKLWSLEQVHGSLDMLALSHWVHL